MFYLISIILIVIIVRNIFSSIPSRKREENSNDTSFNEFKKDQIQDADFEEIDWKL